MGYGCQTVSFSKKMKDYIEECQAIANPFIHRLYPSRPNSSPFAKWPKAIPVKRRNMVTRFNIEKLSKLRKINVGYHPRFVQWNWFAQAKEVEAASQAPTFTKPAASVVIPTQQTTASITFMQPATVPAVPTQPMVILSDQTQKSPGYWVTCKPTRKQCWKEYLMPLKSDWSDSEEEEKEY